jgi:hypothetical protein
MPGIQEGDIQQRRSTAATETSSAPTSAIKSQRAVPVK